MQVIVIGNSINPYLHVGDEIEFVKSVKVG